MVLLLSLSVFLFVCLTCRRCVVVLMWLLCFHIGVSVLDGLFYGGNKRVALSGVWNSDHRMAHLAPEHWLVVAHELGHNFGAQHTWERKGVWLDYMKIGSVSTQQTTCAHVMQHYQGSPYVGVNMNKLHCDMNMQLARPGPMCA